MKVEKTIRHGMVAVILSGDYGAGWYTWFTGSYADALLFEPSIVAWIEGGKTGEFPDIVGKYNIREYLSLRDVDRLNIVWVPAGAKFKIYEYDGLERLVLESEESWIIA